MDMRELKGLEIAARAKIAFDGDAWIVPSQTGTGRYKVVLRPDGDTCTCDDHTLHLQPCKHIHAARLGARTRPRWQVAGRRCRTPFPSGRLTSKTGRRTTALK